jgi:hypothetical protein
MFGSAARHEHGRALHADIVAYHWRSGRHLWVDVAVTTPDTAAALRAGSADVPGTAARLRVARSNTHEPAESTSQIREILKLSREPRARGQRAAQTMDPADADSPATPALNNCASESRRSWGDRAGGKRPAHSSDLGAP